VVDLDIRAFFDTHPWDLTLAAVSKHTDQRWVLLYVERWLQAPLQLEDGTLVERDRGTPQGSAISPLLANMFLHYAFDRWMARAFPAVRFERYAMTQSCTAERGGRPCSCGPWSRAAGGGRSGAQPDKTRIVYCKDDDRRGSYEHSVRLLGLHVPSAAVEEQVREALRELLSGGLRRRPQGGCGTRSAAGGSSSLSDKSLSDLARMFNPSCKGWINYYGRFYKSMLYPVSPPHQRVPRALGHAEVQAVAPPSPGAKGWLASVARREPGLFAHWKLGVRPDGWTMGAR
jgi:RNA-directed DNA polymerase